MKNRITDKDLAALVDAYMKRVDLRDKDDPVNDVLRLAVEHFGDQPISDLEKLAHAVLAARYGGTAVYIKGDPAAAVRADAKLMSFKELQAKYPNY